MSLSISTADKPIESEASHGNNAQIVLADQLEAGRRTRAALRDALLKTKKRGEELNSQMETIQKQLNKAHRSNELLQLNFPSAYSHHTPHSVNFVVSVFNPSP